jgi:hypothetical protein
MSVTRQVRRALGGRNFGQLINECLALALRVATSPTDHLQLQRRDQPLDRQILKVPLMPAVPAR